MVAGLRADCNKYAMPRRAPIVLVTGFTPFGGERINPSWEIAQSLPASIQDATIHTLQVPTIFGDAIRVACKAIDKIAPDIVLCLGQAGGRAAISLERVALNINDASIADNLGQQPIDTPVVARAPAAYFSTLPIKAIVQAIAQKNIPAAVSNSAGTFVCNHLLFGVLHHIAKRHLSTRAGFMHVPYLPAQVAQGDQPSLTLDTMRRATEIAIITAIQFKHDIRRVGGAVS